METVIRPSGLGLTLRVLSCARALVGDTISQKTLSLFFDSIALLLHSGVSLPEALLRSSLVGDPELRHVCVSVAASLSNGASLTRSLRPHARCFPPLVLPLMEVAELSGGLEAVAHRLAVSFNQGAALERRYRTAIFSPWLIILLLGLLQTFSMINQPLLTTVRAVILTLVKLTACYLGGRLVARGLMAWPWLRLQVDTVKIALPHLGTLFRNLAAARWARSFATLWGAGVAVSDALNVSSRSTLNAYYERALRQAARETRQGRSLHQSLGTTKLLPTHLLRVIAVGETSGGLAESLERLASDLEEEAFTRAAQEMMTMVVVGEVLLAIVGVAAVLH